MSGLCPHTHKGIMTRRLIKKEKCLGKDKGGFLLFLHCTVSEIREKGMGRFWEEEEEEEKVSVKKRREREWESTNPESELQTLTAPWMRGCEVGSKAFPIAGFLELIIIAKDPLASSSSLSLSPKDGLWVWLNGWPTQPPLGWMGLQMPERPGLTIGHVPALGPVFVWAWLRVLYVGRWKFWIQVQSLDLVGIKRILLNVQRMQQWIS